MVHGETSGSSVLEFLNESRGHADKPIRGKADNANLGDEKRVGVHSF